MMPKVFPCYTGGKARWVSRLAERFAGRRFVEPFAGSAAISFALGESAWWNDLDPALTTVLARFPEQEVPDVFTLADYAEAARRPDWWRFAFCLSRMAFAGLFRYSRNGFNVSPDRRIPELRLRPEYEAALSRWNALDPVVTCGEWTRVPDEVYRDAVVVLDPPFQGSHTPYNRVADYAAFWRRAEELPAVAEAVIVFGYAEDLAGRFPGREIATRKMRPNGKRAGQVEGMVVLERAA
jgi:hypothetical protein